MLSWPLFLVNISLRYIRCFGNIFLDSSDSYCKYHWNLSTLASQFDLCPWSPVNIFWHWWFLDFSSVAFDPLGLVVICTVECMVSFFLQSMCIKITWRNLKNWDASSESLRVIRPYHDCFHFQEVPQMVLKYSAS